MCRIKAIRVNLSLCLIILVWISGNLVFSEVQVNVAEVTGNPGDAVLLPVSIKSNTISVGIQFDLHFDPTLFGLILPFKLNSEGSILAINEMVPGNLRVIVIPDPVGSPMRLLNNEVLLNINVQISSDAAEGIAPIELSNIIFGDGSAVPIELFSFNNGSIHIRNNTQPPTAFDDGFVLNEDSNLNEILTGSDPNGEPIVFSLVNSPLKGVVVITDQVIGGFSYLPNENENGMDSFQFRVSNGVLESEIATISITITPINDLPEIQTMDTPVIGFENEPILVSATAVDVDGELVSFSWDFGEGTPPVEGLEAQYTYQTDGFYDITLTVTDESNGQTIQTAAIEVLRADDAPEIVLSSIPTIGLVGSNLNFAVDAVGMEGETLTYSWTFGDGAVTPVSEDLSQTQHLFQSKGSYTVSVTVTDSRGEFDEFSQDLFISCRIPVVDFNNDGYQDIFWHDDNYGINLLWLMQGVDLTGTMIMDSLIDSNWTISGLANFNQDEYVDILWSNDSDGRNIITLTDGFSFTQTVNIPNVDNLNWQIEGISDFDHDCKMDVLWRDTQTGDLIVWFLDQTIFQYEMYITSLPDTNWVVTGTGDFNHDTYPDLFLHNYEMGSSSVLLLNDYTAIKTVNLDLAHDTSYRILDLGDYNSDGNLDILHYYVEDGSLAVFMMDGLSLVEQIQLGLNRPVTISVINHADTYIHNGNMKNQNYGSAENIEVKKTGFERGLVFYDIDGQVPTDMTLVKAVVRMYITENDNNWKGTETVGLYRMTQEWTELGATWNCPNDTDTTNSKPDGVTWKMNGSSPGLPFFEDPISVCDHLNGLSGWVEWDVTVEMSEILNDSITYYGWLLKKENETKPGSASYSSKEGEFPSELILVFQ